MYYIYFTIFKKPNDSAYFIFRHFRKPQNWPDRAINVLQIVENAKTDSQKWEGKQGKSGKYAVQASFGIKKRLGI
jgi:hypothetical protein